MRNLVFRFDDSATFLLALREAEQEMVLPRGEVVNDGEWVLAIFEVGHSGRATAAAARGLHRGAGHSPVIAFERRDWDRLEQFAEAGSMSMRAAAMVAPPDVPTKPSLVDPDATIETDIDITVASPDGPPAGFEPWKDSDPFAQSTHARVLLVDDDRDIREVVGAMLDAVGLTVEGATSAEDALERVRRSAFDLVVLDWNLPGMTGIELCRMIRGDASLAALPVLFLTAHASSRDIVEAFASGADDYVVKPFRAPELGARIFGLLRRARLTQPIV